MPRNRIVSGKLAAEVMANGLIASGRNLSSDLGTPGPRTTKKQGWEEEAWYHYDTVEVYHYGVQWVGNTLSRAKLLVHENGKVSTNAEALEIMASFFGGPDQQPEFLRQIGIHMTVCGEAYLFGREVDGKDEWAVIAAVEVSSYGKDNYRIEGTTYSKDEILLVRIWRPHPRKREMADSPTRPLLPILSQITELTQYVSAQLDSRLTGNGILKVPSEVTFPSTGTDAQGNAVQAAGVAGFIREMNETMATAKKNRHSAAARVPTILQAPGEHLDKIDLLKLWSDLDENAPKLRDEAIRRLALGMDMPPEALLGTGDVNHWGAWQIEDSLIKTHSEPLLALITRALTTDYLRVLLIEGGMEEEEAAAFEVFTDTTEMRLRPNRSKEAVELYDRGEISAATMLRENGFDPETDAMEEKELQTWTVKRLAQGSPDSDVVRQAAQLLGVVLKAPAEVEGSADEVREERPLRRSLVEHPRNDPPELEEAALVASAEASLFHALTRVGNKIRSTAARIDGIPAGVPSYDRYRYVTLSRQQIDFVLDDAWPVVGQLTLPAGVTAEAFEAALDSYARLLISNREPYTRDMLSLYLSHALKERD